jgi:hypothetical protein
MIRHLSGDTPPRCDLSSPALFYSFLLFYYCIIYSVTRHLAVMYPVQPCATHTTHTQTRSALAPALHALRPHSPTTLWPCCCHPSAVWEGVSENIGKAGARDTGKPPAHHPASCPCNKSGVLNLSGKKSVIQPLFLATPLRSSNALLYSTFTAAPASF